MVAELYIVLTNPDDYRGVEVAVGIDRPVRGYMYIVDVNI